MRHMHSLFFAAMLAKLGETAVTITSAEAAGAPEMEITETADGFVFRLTAESDPEQAKLFPEITSDRG